MQGIILAGGYGKKLFPYSEHWQKSCIPVGNIPNISRTVDLLQQSGIDKIKVVIGYKGQQVKYALRNKDVEYLELLSGNLMSAIESLLNQDSLIVYGDVVMNLTDINRLIDAYYEEKSPTILYNDFSKYERAIDWISCYVDNDEIKSIYGHPREHYVNSKVSGAFILNQYYKKYISSNPGYMKNVVTGGMPPNEDYLEQSIQMMIEDDILIRRIKAKYKPIDLDKPWHILEANELIISNEVANLTKDEIGTGSIIHSSAIVEGHIKMGQNSYIGKNVIIKGNVVIGDNTSIDYGAIIDGNVIIGNHTTITDYCKIKPFTTIGDKNKIGYNGEVEGITFHGVSIVHNAEIYGVVGQYTDIGAGTLVGSLRFDDCLNTVNINGKQELGSKYTNAVFIGDHCRTGIGSLLLPGVMIGKNSAIGPGAIVSENVPSNTLLMVEQSHSYKYWGPERYGW